MDDELTTPEEENHQIVKQKMKQRRRRKKKIKNTHILHKKAISGYFTYINVIWTRSLNNFFFFRYFIVVLVILWPKTNIHRLWSGFLWHDINLFETEIPKVLSMAVEKSSCVLRKTRHNCPNGNWKVIQTISVYIVHSNGYNHGVV